MLEAEQETSMGLDDFFQLARERRIHNQNNPHEVEVKPHAVIAAFDEMDVDRKLAVIYMAADASKMDKHTDTVRSELTELERANHLEMIHLKSWLFKAFFILTCLGGLVFVTILSLFGGKDGMGLTLDLIKNVGKILKLIFLGS